MLIPPVPATELEMRNRNLEVGVRNRETNDDMKTELYSVSMYENTAEQFLRTATTEKYRIYLGPRIVVAKDATYEGILDDFTLLNKYANINKVEKGEKMINSLIQLIRDLCKEQTQLRAELHPLPAPVAPAAAETQGPAEGNGTATPPVVSGDADKSADFSGADSNANGATSPTSATATLPSIALAAQSQAGSGSSSGTVANGDGEPASKTFTEVVYENQRSLPMGDYSNKYLIPIADKCGPYSDVHGNPKSKEEVKLPENWKWLDDWHADMTQKGIDAEGWEYALNWNMTWSGVRGVTSYVRRRRLVRTRVFHDPAKEKEKANKAALDALNASAAGKPRTYVAPSFSTIFSAAKQLVKVRDPSVNGAEADTILKPDLATLALEALVLALTVLSVLLTFFIYNQVGSLESELQALLKL